MLFEVLFQCQQRRQWNAARSAGNRPGRQVAVFVTMLAQIPTDRRCRDGKSIWGGFLAQAALDGGNDSFPKIHGVSTHAPKVAQP